MYVQQGVLCGDWACWVSILSAIEIEVFGIFFQGTNYFNMTEMQHNMVAEGFQSPPIGLDSPWQLQSVTQILVTVCYPWLSLKQD